MFYSETNRAPLGSFWNPGVEGLVLLLSLSCLQAPSPSSQARLCLLEIRGTENLIGLS